MTEFRIEKIKLPSADFNGVSTLPEIAKKTRLGPIKKVFELSEDDGLFVNYGNVKYAFPYMAQDNYSRELKIKEHDIIVLENDYLKATFLPGFGGKLHSLFDKKNNKELLYVNSVVRPCNLSIRNAWMSGGVEWNCGFMGHNPFTCDLMHTAQTQLDDGTPVLRFYQFERVRAVVYQIDFFLPEDSRFLYARTKIINPHFDVVPMYWWSNIAVSDEEGNRVVVPVENTFTSKNGHPVKIAVPMYNGIDITYPLRNIIAIDYFWNIPEEKRRYICQVNKDGYGLVQTSTKRLRGRKLFVWGKSNGGYKWKNFLTADNESGSYNEIQAGIAQTQYECLPMPPNTTWEWVEAYGAIQTDSSKIHGEWSLAKEEAENRLNDLLTEDYLEKLLVETKKMSKSPAKLLFSADGWGALEEERRRLSEEPEMTSHLDFGKISDEQIPWLSLLKEGTLGEHNPVLPPVSYMCQPEWTDLLKNAVEGKDSQNWFAWYQFGLNLFIEEKYEQAEFALNKSLELQTSAWALYALAILKRDTNQHEKEIELILKAFEILPSDISLAKAVMRCLYENKTFDLTKQIYESMSDELRAIPRCKAYYAFALVNIGDVETAEKILFDDNGLIVPDIREGETITYDLWVEIQKAKGLSTDNPPRFVDFRMFQNSDWLYGGENL